MRTPNVPCEMNGKGLRTRLFDLAGRIPIARETADPWIFVVLTLLVATATVGILYSEDVFPGDEDARAHVIQVAAGMLVILGAYFTAVNIREVCAHQAFERLCRVIEQLGSDNEAVRIGAIRLLESIALERLDLPSGSTGDVRRAREDAIRGALEALADDSAKGKSSVLAGEVLAELTLR